MIKRTSFHLIVLPIFFVVLASCTNQAQNTTNQEITENSLKMGAERFTDYLPLLENKRVALLVNPTSMVGETHLVDALLEKEVTISLIFAPEHGFRGTADAGEQITNGKDSKTGLPIISLYGKNKKPSKEQLESVDVVVFDIQDVGARFYTYISTMSYVMESCAEQNIPFIVLDRPNPNGHYVDGPVLEPSYSSFIGLHQVPVVHGMTVGEYAQMVNGENWLKNGLKCDLTVIPCSNYDHLTIYELPVKPSPNLPNIKSIYLYPSICFFEGTVMSVGRGTNYQFQLFGHPDYPVTGFDFTPVSMEGAKHPKHENKPCRGEFLSNFEKAELYNSGQLEIKWLLKAYQVMALKERFFNKNLFFDKLAGNQTLRNQIISGKTEEEIRQSWTKGIETFKNIRKKYLLYKDFE